MNHLGFIQFIIKTIYDKKEELNKVTIQNVSYSAELKELLKCIKKFTSRFDGFYERTLDSYEMMLKELVATQKQMVIYRDENKEVKRVFDIWYEKWRSTCRRSYLFRFYRLASNVEMCNREKAEEIFINVSPSEKLEKLFPLAIPKKNSYIMAHINNYELFNKLFCCDISSVKEAFALLHKPLWIHETY